MKAKLGDLIYYMRANIPHSAKVFAINVVQNLHEARLYTTEQQKMFTPFGSAGIFYATCHGVIREDAAFLSQEELLRSR